MFDDVIRKLKELERGVQISVEIPVDEEGYLDRRCPHKQCNQDFKVLIDDWKEKVSDERGYCPLCGHYEDSGKWATPEQQKYLSDYATNYVMGKLNKAFDGDVRKFNRSQPRNGWITMKMEYKPDTPKIIVPYDVAELMQQKFSCEKCQCHYSSIGASFFCPACGHNSIERDFRHAVESVEKILDSLEHIKATLIEHQDKDVAINTIRQILETSMGKLTGAFQRLMEALFNKLPQAKQISQRPNVFQNLEESSELWQKAGCKRYEDILESTQWNDLERLFQQRHLLLHCDGIVDQRYIDKSGDTSYKPGQKIIISRKSVQTLADIIKNLSKEKIKEASEVIA